MPDESVGSVSVSIVPDARGWDAKVEAEIGRTTAKVRLILDDAAAKARLDEATKDRDAKVTANAETSEADAKIDETARDRSLTITVDASTAIADAKIDYTARDRTATVKVDADTAAADAQIAATKALAAAPAGGGVAGIAPILGAAALGFAGPLVAGAGALTSPLGPLAAGFGGLGLFGIAAKNQITATNAINTQLTADAKAATNATTMAARTKALQAYAAAYSQLTVSQKQFLAGESALSDAWNKLTTGTDVFGPINLGMGILTKALPKLKPLLDVVDTSLTDILKHVDSYMATGQFDHFVKGVSSFAGPAIKESANIIGNLGTAFVGWSKAFGPLGLQMLTGLDHLTASFAKWTQGQGMQSFVAYVSTEGPKVLHTLGDLVVLLTHLVEAGAPISGALIPVLDGLVKVLNLIPPHALTPVVVGIAGITLGLKAMNAVGGLVGLGNGLALVGGMSDKAGSGLVGGFGQGLSNVSKRLSESKVNMGLFSAGLVGLVVSSTSANTSVNLLGDAVSGLMMGASIGGAPGAIAGGVIGTAIGALSTLLHHNSQAFDQAKQQAADYASTLKGVTAAITDATRAQAIQNLGAGKIRTAASYGISSSTLANAALGDTGAQSQIQAAAARTIGAAEKSGAGFDTIQRMVSAYDDLMVAIGGSSQGLKDQQTVMQAQARVAWSATTGTQAYAKALKSLPAKAITEIKALNVQPETAAVIELLSHYKATPKQIQTYLAAIGVQETIKQINDAIAAAQKAGRQHPVIAIDANTGAAVTKIRSLRQTINSLTSPIPIPFSVTTTGSSKPHKALGGAIFGAGTGTSDSIPAMLSNGEFVVNAKATAQYRPLLEAINAKHFATGGYASGPLTPGQLIASLPAIASKGKKGKRGKGSRSPAASFPVKYENAAVALALAITNQSTLTQADAALKRFTDSIIKSGGQMVSQWGPMKASIEAVVIKLQAAEAELKAFQQAAQQVHDSLLSTYTSNPFSNMGNGTTPMSYTVMDASGHPIKGLSQGAQSALINQSANGTALPPEVIAELNAFSTANGYTPTVQSTALPPQLALAMQNSQLLAGVKGQGIQATAFANDLSILKNKGLSGYALSQLAQSMNLQEADYLTTLSPAQLRDYTQAFQQRQNAVNSAASSAQTTLLADVSSSTAGTQRAVNNLTKQLNVLLGEPKQHQYATWVGQSVATAINTKVANGQQRGRG